MARTPADLAARAQALAEPGRRRLLGIAGSPGSGKSTLAAELAATVIPPAVVVPMDGFHLSNEVLAYLGLSDRKGSPPSFDVAGFQVLLRRLRDEKGVVYAPAFRRDLEETVGAAIAVPASVPLVIVEGSYLLLEQDGWEGTAGLLDEVWYVQPDEATRLERLIRRHQEHGRSRTEAEEWVAHNDEPNARVVEATRERADVVVGMVANP